MLTCPTGGQILADPATAADSDRRRSIDIGPNAWWEKQLGMVATVTESDQVPGRERLLEALDELLADLRVRR